MGANSAHCAHELRTNHNREVRRNPRHGRRAGAGALDGSGLEGPRTIPDAEKPVVLDAALRRGLPLSRDDFWPAQTPEGRRDDRRRPLSPFC